MTTYRSEAGLVTTGSPAPPAGDGTTILGFRHAGAVVGTHAITDLFAFIRDIVGGRAASYEHVVERARRAALRQLLEQARFERATHVTDLRIQIAGLGPRGALVAATATGTFVRVAASTGETR